MLVVDKVGLIAKRRDKAALVTNTPTPLRGKSGLNFCRLSRIIRTGKNFTRHDPVCLLTDNKE